MSLPSSDKLIAALIKGGFYPRGKSKRGSHQVFRKELPEGARNVVVPLGKKGNPSGYITEHLAASRANRKTAS